MFPQSVRLVSLSPDVSVNIAATLAAIETNVDLDPAAFTAALAADPALAVAFAKVADFEDSLIHADLVARNLI